MLGELSQGGRALFVFVKLSSTLIKILSGGLVLSRTNRRSIE